MRYGILGYGECVHEVPLGVRVNLINLSAGGFFSLQKPCLHTMQLRTKRFNFREKNAEYMIALI